MVDRFAVLFKFFVQTSPLLQRTPKSIRSYLQLIVHNRFLNGFIDRSPNLSVAQAICPARNCLRRKGLRGETAQARTDQLDNGVFADDED